MAKIRGQLFIVSLLSHSGERGRSLRILYWKLIVSGLEGLKGEVSLCIGSLLILSKEVSRGVSLCLGICFLSLGRAPPYNPIGFFEKELTAGCLLIARFII